MEDEFYSAYSGDTRSIRNWEELNFIIVSKLKWFEYLDRGEGASDKPFIMCQMR